MFFLDILKCDVVSPQIKTIFNIRDTNLATSNILSWFIKETFI
jgi:hypothetical protein